MYTGQTQWRQRHSKSNYKVAQKYYVNARVVQRCVCVEMFAFDGAQKMSAKKVSKLHAATPNVIELTTKVLLCEAIRFLFSCCLSMDIESHKAFVRIFMTIFLAAVTICKRCIR